MEHKFKVGDKVQVITDTPSYSASFHRGDTGTVVRNDDALDVKRDSDSRIQTIRELDIALIMPFKVGDKVQLKPEVLDACPCSGITPRTVGTITAVHPDHISINFGGDKTCWAEHAERFNLAEDEAPTPAVKLYKAFRVLPDGRLASLIIRQPDYVLSGQYKELFYKEGAITYAPEGSFGIICDNTAERAERWAKQHSSMATAVHEVTALGNIVRLAITSDSAYLCPPAVLVGRKVYGFTPAPPCPFNLGDMVKLVKLPPYTTSFKVGETYAVHSFTSTTGHPDRLRVVNDKGYTQVVDWIGLELAPPKEEWKDVTRECATSISSSRPAWVSVWHGGLERILLGSKGIEEFSMDGGRYELETFPTGGCSYKCGGFRLWKKTSV